MSASERRWGTRSCVRVNMSYRDSLFGVRNSREGIERIEIRGHSDWPVQLLLDRAAERLRGGRIAVNEIDLLRRRGETRKPANQFAAIGVCGKLADFGDFRAHRNVLAVDARDGGAVEQMTPERSVALVAGKDDCVFRIGQSPREVMQDASAGAHAARGHDDAWRDDAIDLF